MVDFSNLKTLDITGKTAEYVLYELDEDPKPVLVVKPIGADNKPYFNEILRRFGGDTRRLKALSSDAEAVEKMRASTRELFPKHVIAGWRGVKDHAGVDVPFSEEAAAAFMGALPGDMVDDIRAFADDPANFRKRQAPAIDVDALAGN